MMRYAFIVLVLLLILVAGCALSVSKLNADKEGFVGEKVTVSGVVKSTIKIGAISGYELRDKETDETISISAQKLPVEGETVTVKGTWMKDTIFGYYLKADE